MMDDETNTESAPFGPAEIESTRSTSLKVPVETESSEGESVKMLLALLKQHQEALSK